MIPMGVDHGRILAIAFALDDAAVAMCTSDGLVRVRGISTGLDLRSWQCHQPPREIECAAFSSNSTHVATSLPRGDVLVWSINTGEEMFALRGLGGTITGIAFSFNGRLATISSKPSTVRFWDGHTGIPIGDPLLIEESTEHDMFRCLAISPDGTVTTMGLSTDGKLEVHDLSTQTPASVLVDSRSPTTLLAFSPDELHLAVVCHDTIHFWDRRTMKETARSLRGHTGRINFISHSPDGVYIASASSDHTIRIWDAGSNMAATQPLMHPSEMTCLVLSSNNDIIVSGLHRGSVQVWDTQTGRLKQQSSLGNEGVVSSVAISPNGLLIASASRFRKTGRRQVAHLCCLHAPCGLSVTPLPFALSKVPFARSCISVSPSCAKHFCCLAIITICLQAFAGPFRVKTTPILRFFVLLVINEFINYASHLLQFTEQGRKPRRQIEQMTEGPAELHDMAVKRSFNEPMTQVTRY